MVRFVFSFYFFVSCSSRRVVRPPPLVLRTAIKGNVDASGSPSPSGRGPAAKDARALSAPPGGSGGSGGSSSDNRNGAPEGFDKAAGDMRRPEVLALSGKRVGPGYFRPCGEMGVL